jgi:hypothetical protein
MIIWYGMVLIIVTSALFIKSKPKKKMKFLFCLLFKHLLCINRIYYHFIYFFLYFNILFNITKAYLFFPVHAAVIVHLFQL